MYGHLRSFFVECLNTWFLTVFSEMNNVSPIVRFLSIMLITVILDIHVLLISGKDDEFPFGGSSFVFTFT